MSRQTKPVCGKCRLEMFVSLNGVNVLFNAGFGPYEVHQGDLWCCRGCDAQIVNGWGNGALASHIDEDFQQLADTCTYVVEERRVAQP